MTKRIHVLLGGMTGGELDKPFNRGMYDLVDMLKPLGDVQVWTWGQWVETWQSIYDHWVAEDKIIIIGYSGGGSRGTYLCNGLNPSLIDLFIAYDPSPASQMHSIHSNVAKAVCYYNECPLMWWPGVGKLGGGRITTKASQPPPTIETITIKEQHLCVQHDECLHHKTVDHVKQL